MGLHWSKHALIAELEKTAGTLLHRDGSIIAPFASYFVSCIASFRLLLASSPLIPHC